MLFFSSFVISAGVVTADVVSNINTRFNEGKPSSNLTEAGVSMHQFDSLEAVDFHQMWRPYTPEECNPLSNHANCEYHDRVSSLLVNNQVRNPEGGLNPGAIPLYTYTRGGVINPPKYTTVMCAYSEDGGTMDRTNRGCGCHAGDTVCENLGFDNSCALEGSSADFKKCWWGQEDLDKMMNKQKTIGVYNELVVDSNAWLGYLPYSVEAFFYIKNDKQSETETRDSYERFQSEYPDACAPLLILDFNARENPFSLASGSTTNTGCVDIAQTTSTSSTTSAPGTTTTSVPETTPGSASGLQLGAVTAGAVALAIASLL